MKSKPLDLTEDIDKYKAYEERKELSSDRCDHKSVKHKDGVLLCTCGASWSGPQLDKLYKLLTER